MSRIIVKNLPKSVTEDKLREIFGEKGIVTDVQLKYTKDGKFRHFGFIGYKSEDAAQEAVNYFDNTCIKSARIKVELCAALGDPKKPKAWSKYAPDSTAFKKIHGKPEEETKKEEKKKKKNDKIQEILEKHKDDPLFKEFIEAHAKGSKTLQDVILPEIKETKKNKTVTEEDVVEENDDSGHESKGSEQSDDSDAENTTKIATKKEISDLEYLKMMMVKEDEIKTDVSDEDAGKKKKKKKKKSKKEPRKVKDEETETEVKEEEAGDEEDEDEEEEEEVSKKGKKEPKTRVNFFTVKLRGLSYNGKKKDVKHFFLPLKPKSIRLPVKMKGIAYVGFKTEKEMKQALTKHRSFLAGRRICVLKYNNMNDDKSFEEQDRSQWQEQEEKLKNEETIAESGRLFIRNLSYTVTEDDIENLFKQYGPLAEVNMPVDRMTRKPKGFALVTFVMPEHAVIAHSQLDGTVFHGRMLHVLPGKAKKTIEELLESEHLSFKQKKLLKEKAQAKSSHNWNSLFLGQNAVADIIAETYNTTKEKVLDARGSESLAVRLALGETQIVTETREFLLKNGVSLDAFNQAPKEGSKTIILAKNLPAKTTVGEIQQLFMKHGEIGRVVMPPSGVTAIIEFLEPSEARNAFTKLAYTKFKNLPLYLEWAPSDTFTSSVTKEPKKNNAKKKGNEEDDNTKVAEKEPEKSEDAVDETSEEEDEEEPEPDTTLFIKNLNFNTREDAIKEHFKKCGPIHYVTVALKKDPSKPGELLSMGYGFIQFKKKAAVEKALKTLQHTVLEGHTLELKRSNRTLQSEVATARKKTKIGKQTGCKILVRNIPFQANKKEVEDLFKTFGKLKALRLPKKMVGTGPHRGFAFIEYYTKHDAKRAFEALCQSTHLYGRRLVLEWATTEESIDDIRKRTADHFAPAPTHHTSKKSTVDFVPDDDET
ncbi:probable RNA-binding protein 19 isoform X1 [Anabrus simplex]|uniref:probable RNA-binding protein 19 isoform X1 n=1 Tax=Anabrus simplex TaxID=316456 RepID=UPI0035A3298B